MLKKTYPVCSAPHMELMFQVCCDIGFTKKDLTVTLTAMEEESIRRTRTHLYDALVDIGVADSFNNCSGEQIDHVIRQVWAGLRAAMDHQSMKGEIPF